MASKLRDRRFKNATKRMLNFVKRDLPDDMLKQFKALTPKAGGNARRNTTLKRTASGFEIKGDYNYSGVIDRGEYPNPPVEGTGKTSGGYSTQSPKGMTDPTLQYGRQEVKKFIRRNT